jgi:DNA-binding NtrC family response regulator
MAHIVIACEQAHIRHVLTMWLTRYDHDVVEASTGEVALRAVQTGPVDVLITDADLLAHYGGRLLPAVLGTCKDLRRVFVFADPPDQQDLLASSADPRMSFLSRPFSPGQLLLDIAAAVDGAQPTLAATLARRAATADASDTLPRWPTTSGGDG